MANDTTDPGQLAEQASDDVAVNCTNRFYDTVLKGGEEGITREQFQACLKVAAMQGYGAGFNNGAVDQLLKQKI
jgi:hypothetical protein